MCFVFGGLELLCIKKEVGGVRYHVIHPAAKEEVLISWFEMVLLCTHLSAFNQNL